MDKEDLWFLDGYESYENDSNFTDENCCNGGDICDLNEGMRFEALFLPVLYSLAFVAGVLGNGVLLGVLAQSRKTWSVTDTFILHLGVADVLLLVTLPFWAAQAVHGWTFGTVLCKITGAIFTVRGVQQGRCIKTACIKAKCMIVTIQCLQKDFSPFYADFFAPSDQLLLWDLPSGLHQSGPLPVHCPCYPDVLPQEAMGGSGQLFGSVAFLPAPLYS